MTLQVFTGYTSWEDNWHPLYCINKSASKQHCNSCYVQINVYFNTTKCSAGARMLKGYNRFSLAVINGRWNNVQEKQASLRDAKRRVFPGAISPKRVFPFSEVKNGSLAKSNCPLAGRQFPWQETKRKKGFPFLL